MPNSTSINIAMPWEKSFNEQEVLDKAMHVFWQKGFDSTSIADLIENTGLNRGSLYNAYGGKQQLFVKVLLNYDETRLQALASLEALDDPNKAISTFFDNIVSMSVADPNRKGCFLFNTALDVYAHDQQVRQIVTNGVAQIEAFLRRSIEVGQVRGSIRSDLIPTDTAKTLLALALAIRVLSRGVFNDEALKTIADQAKQLVNLPISTAVSEQ
ncbi:MAG: TetR/AcrR family transcriptional regulator [Arenicella sp.]|nr:TetR/AcrR family transcriptional regulator [Arenicella sp.]